MDVSPPEGPGTEELAARLLAARSGRPAGGSGMCVAVAALCGAMRFDVADPDWPDRDRCVAAGEAAEVLAAALSLAGRPTTPPPHDADGLDAVAPGFMLAAGVGMALAERVLAARFGRSLVDHRCWVLAGAAELDAGLSHEAAGLAAELRLDRLVVLCDAHEAGTAERLRRFGALGWTARLAEGVAATAAALGAALRGRKPTLLACRDVAELTPDEAAASQGGGCDPSTSGAAPDARPAGGPDARAAVGAGAQVAGAAGASDGRGSAAEARAAGPSADGGMDVGGMVPDAGGLDPEDPWRGVEELWRQLGRRGAPARRAWLRRVARHGQAAEFGRVFAGRLPFGWEAPLRRLRAASPSEEAGVGAGADLEALQGAGLGVTAWCTGAAGRQALDALSGAVPELLGGWAGAEPDEPPPPAPPVLAGQYGGRHVPWGAREGGAAAVMNGMALHGGLIPASRARFAAGDGLRTALHLAARLRRRVVHVLTQDDPAAGHMPAGQLASLRAVPDLHVLRPADAVETVECWELALRRAEGPSLLVLSDRAAPCLRPPAAEPEANRCARGGYVLAEAEGERRATLIASGPELAVAVAAQGALVAAGLAVAVVSLPCWELFGQQDEDYRQAVLGEAPRFAVEAAQGFGWERWLGPEGVFIGPEDAAQPSPPPTAEAVCAVLLRTLS